MTRTENERSLRLLQRTSHAVTPTNADQGLYSQAQLVIHYADVHMHVVESLSGNMEWMINTRRIELAVVYHKEKILHRSTRATLEEVLFLIGTDEINTKKKSYLTPWI